MVTTLGWGLTLAAIIALLGLDLSVAGRRSASVGLRQAVAWSVFYIAAALVLGAVSGWGLAGQYFAGYVVEKSLSVDNLFVFVIILAAFAVPAAHQTRALTIGIALALSLRAILIALAATLLDAFSFMFAVFGLVLFATAVQLLRHRHRTPSVRENRVVAATRRVLPVSDRYHAGRLTVRIDGRRSATPMLMVLIAIASTDAVFALDSIPAVFGVTQHAYIVFCANAFALLGLRALFFVVSGLVDRLIYLSIGPSVILAFIATKLVLHSAHLHVLEASAGRLDPDPVAAVIETAGQRIPRIQRPAGLTEREAEVVRMLARGLQTKQVARELAIATKTADRHIQNAYAKMGVSTRAGATVFAMQHGLMTWGELPIVRVSGRA
ncbi:MAG: TerC/Alx family metal homeostasis membrane protein [Solirubrobacteraceae bacterium]